MRGFTLGMMFLFLTLLLEGTAFADNINIENARVFAEDGFVRAIVDVESSKSMSGVKTQVFILRDCFAPLAMTVLSVARFHNPEPRT